MSDWIVLGTGPSMSAEIASRTVYRNVVAVSDAFELAPHAKAMAASDAAWWRFHRRALDFPGRKFTVARTPEPSVEKLQLPTDTNSGLLAVNVAQLLGATRIFLFGIDLAGAHYFGRHPEPLQNTEPHRFDVMRKQFSRWAGVPVHNCSPISTLDCFPFADPEEVLC